MTTFHPYILGSGSSGKAVAKSLAVLRVLHPEWEIVTPVQLRRDVDWDALAPDPQRAVLFVANPHGLHTETVLAAEKAGFRHIVVEKPAAVTLTDVERLAGVKAEVAVLHGYRNMWGPQYLREQLVSGEWGQLVAVEGRYWQSSAAQRALSGKPAKGWKDDRALSGDFDTYLDLGTHWADLAFFLAGAPAEGGAAWRGFANADSPHRDTHVHLQLRFPGGVHGLASISKTWHGAGNELELNVVCERASATWRFDRPDEVIVGRGASRTTVARPASDPRGSQQAPGHGLGWIEGYVEITAQMLRKIAGEPASYPTLPEHLAVLRTMLTLVG